MFLANMFSQLFLIPLHTKSLDQYLEYFTVSVAYFSVFHKKSGRHYQVYMAMPSAKIDL